jgi:hypothetical protein
MLTELESEQVAPSRSVKAIFYGKANEVDDVGEREITYEKL